MKDVANPGTENACTPLADHLKIGGITPFTTTDYPGQLAMAVFVQGCPWRCGYCHNPHLQQRTSDSLHPWDDVLNHLVRRIGLLDAVVFSGGEPTIDPALPAAIRQVRELGYKVGLHTAGCYPRRLSEVLPLLDWVGLDFKSSPSSYDKVTQTRGSIYPVQESLHLLLESGVEFETRTTIHPLVHDTDELLDMAQDLARQGVRRHALQEYRSIGCADTALAPAASADLGAALAPRLREYFPQFTLRSG